MKQTRKRKMLSVLVVLLALVALAVAMPRAVFAATASGTDITNQATVNYKVGGSSQSAINSNTTTFKVDNKVNPSITADDGSTVTIYPATQKALKFTLTNDGNTTQDFKLAAIVNGSNTFTATAVPGIKFYKDDGGSSGSWDGTDTVYPTSGSDYYVDELAKAGTATIFLVVNAPNGATSGQVATYALKAITNAGGGASSLGGAIANTSGADTAGSVDIVFADGDGDGGGSDDASYDGAYAKWAGLGFTVATASITVTKTSAVISDPVNGTNGNQKAIPGAVIEYTITVSNGSGAQQATEITVTDTVGSNTTFSANGYDTAKGIRVTSPNFSTSPLNMTNADDGDEDGTASGTQEAKFVSSLVTVGGITLSASESATIKFRVTID